MRVNPNYRYSENHLWFSIDGTLARVGVTEFISGHSGGVEKVELDLSEGDSFDSGDIIGTIISPEGEFEIIMPFGGTVKRVNWEAIESPDIINEMPYSEGWILEVEFDEIDEDSLMSASEYKEFIQQYSEE